MRNLMILGMIGAAAFMAGWFQINRDADHTTIEFNRAEIREDARRAIERGREILERSNAANQQAFADGSNAGSRFPDPGSNQGFPNQGFSNQSFPNQGFQNQGFQNQGFPNQGAPNQGFPNQSFQNQSFQNQNFPNQTFPTQTFQNQTFQNQSFPGQPNYGQPASFRDPSGFPQRFDGNNGFAQPR